jgi:hypothetical protein
MSHVARTSWLQFFLYNADGLTLPLFRESLSQHQYWMPVVSTQLLIFPEGAIYAICSAMTTSIRASLVLNGYVNVLLLYVAARALATAAISRPQRRGAAAAVFCGGLVALMLLEVQVSNANLQFATLCLLTTYYYGLVLGGVILLAATVRQLDGEGRTIGGWTFVAVVLSTLIYFSNPLFLLWVTAPLLVTVFILVVLRRATPRRGALVTAGQIASVIAGSLLRRPFRSDIGSSANSYVKFGQIRQALLLFHQMLGDAWSHPSERAELCIIMLVLVGGVIQLVFLVKRPDMPEPDRNCTALAIVTFSLVAPAVDVVGVLASGNSTSRYFIPVFAFSMLSLLPLINLVPKIKVSFAWLLFIGPALAAGVVLFGIAVLPTLGPLLNPNDFADGQCLERALAGQSRTGVSDFYTARPLDVYASSGVHILQVLPNLLPFAWLVNIGEFDHADVTFVLVDRVIGPPVGLVQADTKELGRPVSTSTCPTFTVYSYPRGTRGYKVLNSTISSWFGAVKQKDG